MRLCSLLLLLALTASCSGNDPNGTTASTSDSAPSRAPKKPPEVPVEWSRAANHRVLWLTERCGYVPTEVAQKYHRYPDRFVLYGDGTLIYRNDHFDHSRVKLEEEEVRELLDLAVDSGLLHYHQETPEELTMIVDAGSESLGLSLERARRELDFNGGLRMQQRFAKDSSNLDSLVELRARLADYTHPRAESYHP